MQIFLYNFRETQQPTAGRLPNEHPEVPSFSFLISVSRVLVELMGAEMVAQMTA